MAFMRTYLATNIGATLVKVTGLYVDALYHATSLNLRVCIERASE